MLFKKLNYVHGSDWGLAGPRYRGDMCSKLTISDCESEMCEWGHIADMNQSFHKHKQVIINPYSIIIMMTSYNHHTYNTNSSPRPSFFHSHPIEEKLHRKIAYQNWRVNLSVDHRSYWPILPGVLLNQKIHFSYTHKWSQCTSHIQCSLFMVKHFDALCFCLDQQKAIQIRSKKTKHFWPFLVENLVSYCFAWEYINHRKWHRQSAVRGADTMYHTFLEQDNCSEQPSQLLTVSQNNS